MSSMKSLTYSHQWQCLVDFTEKRFPAVSLWIQTHSGFVFQRRAGGMWGVWKSHFHQYILGWFCSPGVQKEKQGHGREERRNTQLVCRGMKVLVCSHRPARASATPRRASGWQHLHELLGKFMVCMEGLCSAPALPQQFLHFQRPKHFHVVMERKSLASVIKLFCSIQTKLSARKGYTLQKMWLCGHLIT